MFIILKKNFLNILSYLNSKSSPFKYSFHCGQIGAFVINENLRWPLLSQSAAQSQREIIDKLDNAQQ